MSGVEEDGQTPLQKERPMTAAERRRQKILSRGTSRIDQITGSFQTTTGAVYVGRYHGVSGVEKSRLSHVVLCCVVVEAQSSSLVQDTVQHTEGEVESETRPCDGVESTARASGASPKLPPQRPKVRAERAAPGVPVHQRRKVGTLADAKWNEYSVSAKDQQRKKRMGSNIQLATLTRVERMRAVVPLSKGPRVALVVLVAICICMVKEGEHLQLENMHGNAILASREQMVQVCSSMVVGGLKTLTTDTLASCISSSRYYCVLHIKNSVESLARNGFVAYVLHARPMLLVFAASLSMMLAVFFSSIVAPSILADSIDTIASQQKDGGLLQKAFNMLPPNILTICRGLEVLRLVVNTLFLDAGLYIVVLVTYQLFPLAYGFAV